MAVCVRVVALLCYLFPPSHPSTCCTNRSLDQSQSEKGTSKLIEDEERETGNVNSEVYKQYCTEAYGWWGVAAVIVTSVFWQLSFMGGDYWLAYETSESTVFRPSLFLGIYLAIAGVACVSVVIRAFLVANLGLKTAQKFFSQILHSILHAPMSFFDTTPSGRILSRVCFTTFINILCDFTFGLLNLDSSKVVFGFSRITLGRNGMVILRLRN